ncbi:putative mucin TcMUCII [Trypanosoma cruzi]|uniref:Mucin TcMUCII, putative n=2 Tax=Trypanosoma cruzi TaxID=5693 RepID=Q4D3N4_TRYCC|nr:mucin TcMUCII, putative [Trypanosoma cruzi]EAN87136.1 mucin TcMUCII, putative [Trypanosoma cruzi]PWV15799.1 putative mucin TcMUCII [Trypanosoma cruzi]RNC34935.1 mucin TcMUCII [Trypanosoma cruzi]|eukprot:XP_808987.1 mucin TcMUCII [Trypanosoma cruzi strain CL Brener]
MMMTCRLLCALLVLALCCCPSVCVTETQLKDNENRAQEKESGIQPPPPKPPTAMSVDTHDSVGSHSSTAKVVTVKGAAQAGSPGLGSSAEVGMLDRDETRLSALERQPDDEKNTVQAEGTKEQQSRTSTSSEQKNMESEAFAQTTTTTTKPPTTTTTTTTTTEAPSTTTTEAPATTTTTSAPSRLREMDGSLSSSAWVCAPLVLAASALAYTAVG